MVHPKRITAHHIVWGGFGLVAQRLIFETIRCVTPVDAATPAPFGFDTLERGISIVFTVVVIVSPVVVVVVVWGAHCVAILEFDVFYCLLELFHFVCQFTDHLLHIIYRFYLVGQSVVCRC